MSTTTDISVAVHYGLSKGSLLFMIKVENFMQGRRRIVHACLRKGPQAGGAGDIFPL